MGHPVDDFLNAFQMGWNVGRTIGTERSRAKNFTKFNQLVDQHGGILSPQLRRYIASQPGGLEYLQVGDKLSPVAGKDTPDAFDKSHEKWLADLRSRNAHYDSYFQLRNLIEQHRIANKSSKKPSKYARILAHLPGGLGELGQREIDRVLDGMVTHLIDFKRIGGANPTDKEVQRALKAHVNSLHSYDTNMKFYIHHVLPEIVLKYQQEAAGKMPEGLSSREQYQFIQDYVSKNLGHDELFQEVLRIAPKFQKSGALRDFIAQHDIQLPQTPKTPTAGEKKLLAQVHQDLQNRQAQGEEVSTPLEQVEKRLAQLEEKETPTPKEYKVLQEEKGLLQKEEKALKKKEAQGQDVSKPLAQVEKRLAQLDKQDVLSKEEYKELKKDQKVLEYAYKELKKKEARGEEVTKPLEVVEKKLEQLNSPVLETKEEVREEKTPDKEEVEIEEKTPYHEERIEEEATPEKEELFFEDTSPSHQERVVEEETPEKDEFLFQERTPYSEDLFVPQRPSYQEDLFLPQEMPAAPPFFPSSPEESNLFPPEGENEELIEESESSPLNWKKILRGVYSGAKGVLDGSMLRPIGNALLKLGALSGGGMVRDSEVFQDPDDPYSMNLFSKQGKVTEKIARGDVEGARELGGEEAARAAQRSKNITDPVAGMEKVLKDKKIIDLTPQGVTDKLGYYAGNLAGGLLVGGFKPTSVQGAKQMMKGLAVGTAVGQGTEKIMEHGLKEIGLPDRIAEGLADFGGYVAGLMSAHKVASRPSLLSPKKSGSLPLSKVQEYDAVLGDAKELKKLKSHIHRAEDKQVKKILSRKDVAEKLTDVGREEQRLEKVFQGLEDLARDVKIPASHIQKSFYDSMDKVKKAYGPMGLTGEAKELHNFLERNAFEFNPYRNLLEEPGSPVVQGLTEKQLLKRIEQSRNAMANAYDPLLPKSKQSASYHKALAEREVYIDALSKSNPRLSMGLQSALEDWAKMKSQSRVTEGLRGLSNSKTQAATVKALKIDPQWHRAAKETLGKEAYTEVRQILDKIEDNRDALQWVSDVLEKSPKWIKMWGPLFVPNLKRMAKKTFGNAITVTDLGKGLLQKKSWRQAWKAGLQALQERKRTAFLQALTRMQKILEKEKKNFNDDELLIGDYYDKD